MKNDLDYNKIGHNIRFYRQRAGLRQNQLSCMIGVSAQHISNIESGTNLSLPVLVRIANALSIDVNSLLGDNIVKEPDKAFQEALLDRTKNFSPEDYEKLINLCDIIFD